MRYLGFWQRHWQAVTALMIVAVAAAASWQIVSTANRRLTFVPQALAECQAAAPDYRCYAKYFAQVAYDQSVSQAFAEMEAAYVGDAFVKAECHQLSHVIGRTAYVKTGSLEKAYASGNNFCWSGFYHGAIEHAIAKLGPSAVSKNAATVCQAFADKARYSFNHFNCVHGLGHGLMAVAKYNLFDGLANCNATRTAWEQESCYGGVFMENVMVASRGTGQSTYLDPARPLYPCSAVEIRYKQQCYLMQTSYILQHNGYDFAETFRQCARADAGFVETCYQSAGRDASGSTNSDVGRTVGHCRALPADSPDLPTAVYNCMLGAARDFVSYYHSDQQAGQLCEAFGGELTGPCRSAVSSYYATF